MIPILSSINNKKNNHLNQDRDERGRFMKTKQNKVNKFWKDVKNKYFEILFLLTVCILTGCATKYQVVSDLGNNSYHMHNIKKNKIEIITTTETLKIDGWYNLKRLK